MDKITGVEPAPLASVPHADYPKWIVPHGSHVDESGRALAFQFHKGRDGVTTILVMSKNEEEIALAPKSKGAQPEEEKETI